ncbi:unnamed protein product [Ambrosiozyma monospora]|uniref:Unnamed protein product n=1 Tax=Ambrosiozyma monospora TaxID=43982 RepID=A0ACB5TSH7_AMBMO|nr:unnamed protein product [Ambrosiozyma monospora]
MTDKTAVKTEASDAVDVDKEEDSIDVSLLLKRPDPSQGIVPKELPEFTLEQFQKEKSDVVQPFKIHADLSQFTAVEKSVIDHIPTYEPFTAKEKDHVVERHLFSNISAMLPAFDEDAEWEKIIFKKQKESDKHGVPYQKSVFGSYRRFNILKPPMPPSIKNLELRIPTIWLPQDDKYLIRYVTDFSFNWSIISAHLSPKPTRSFTSNIERRTPWQCFERYIQLNDKFQFSDMRGIYAVAAKEWLEAAHKAQATTKRRISPLGVGVESIQRGHRRLRWGSMFDAMRKLMKKRENVPKPSQQTRKVNVEEKRQDTPTPEQLSALKYERKFQLFQVIHKTLHKLPLLLISNVKE